MVSGRRSTKRKIPGSLMKRILVVDNHSKHTAKIARLFSGCSINVCECENFDPEKAETFDLVIFSGGSHTYAADNTKNAYVAEIEFINNATKPVVGICLGCQLIAKAFGGSLSKLDEKINGICDIEFSGKKYRVYESHRYVIHDLPPELSVIGYSDTGPEIIRHQTKPIFGFQFHPEVYPRRSDGKTLFWKIMKDRV